MAIKLLLADDSPTISKILQMALQAEPYEIRSVLTAEAALKELKKNPPDVFLVDLSLPEKNGDEFARMIKRDPALAKVRVVMLASAFDPVNENEIKASGADAVIKKPFDPADLRAKLRSVVDVPGEAPVQKSVLEEAGDLDEASQMLGSAGQGGGDANSILSGILGSGPAQPSPPASRETSFTKTGERSLPPAEASTQFTNATVQLDLSESNEKAAPEEAVLDLTDSFGGLPGGLTTVETGLTPAPIPVPPPTVETSRAAAIPPAAPEPSLSANAQALAAFFDAEISSKQIPSPGPQPPIPHLEQAPAAQEVTLSDEDAFDASLSSIEWATPATESLSSWSSSPTKGNPLSTPPQPKAPERPAPAAPRPVAPAPKPQAAAAPSPAAAPKRAAGPAASYSSASRAAGASAGESMMFDTGGSTFRFADDYVNRITRAFTGSTNENVPSEHGATEQPASRTLFPQKSDDSPLRAPSSGPGPAAGGGAWSEQDVQKIEQIVREEVQMVIREVAEKVAWEVIPELAENLIRKELDKVLREMDRQ